MKPALKTPFLILLIFGSFLVLALSQLLSNPIYMVDEAVFSDVARNLIEGKGMGSNLFAGLFPGVEQCACWGYLMFLPSLAVWLKVFGVSIVNQRLFSLVFGLAALVAYFLLARQFLRKNPYQNLLSFLAVLALILDFNFIRAARISRPEILVLFFSLISLLLFKRWFDNQQFFSIKAKYWLLIGSGVFSGLALLSHFLGIWAFASIFITYLILTKGKFLKDKEFFLFLLSFLTVILVGIFSVLPYLEIFKEQFFLTIARKAANWLIGVLLSGNLILIIAYLGYLSLTVVFIIQTFLRKKREHYLLAISLILSWFLAIKGHLVWYMVYPITILYLAVPAFLSEEVIKKPKLNAKIFFENKPLFFGAVLALVISVNAVFQMDSLLKEAPSYAKFADSIREVVPEEKNILLSSLPDLYFALGEDKRNRIFEFPLQPVLEENLRKVLDKVDFIIYDFNYERAYHEKLFNSYLEKNQKVTKEVREGGFQAFVVELKPIKERVSFEELKN